MGSLSLAHPKDCPISAPKQAPLWSSPPEGADIPSFRSEHQKPESSFTLLCTFCPTCNPSKLQAAPPEDAARSPRFPSPLAPAAPGWAPCSHVRPHEPSCSWLAFLRAPPSSQRNPSKPALHHVPRCSEPRGGPLLPDGRTTFPQPWVLHHLPCHLSHPVPNHPPLSSSAPASP